MFNSPKLFLIFYDMEQQEGLHMSEGTIHRFDFVEFAGDCHKNNQFYQIMFKLASLRGSNIL